MSMSQDPCARPQLLHPDDAVPMLLQQVVPLYETETVPLTEALGRILAEDLCSSIELPPFNNSGMDGYAYRFADLPVKGTLTVIGKSFAGHPYTGEYQPGSCIRIMTGATVPNGYDTVQMQEYAEVNGDQVTLEPCSEQWENVRLRGGEITAGAKVLTSGTEIRAAEMGIIATIGISHLRVFRRARVAFFSTGDELRPVGSELAPGQIYDSNRYSIKGLLIKAGVEWIDLGVIKDDPEAIRQAFREAAARADMVLTSGGVSVGEADFTKQVLDEEGKITFWKLAMKPGKPFAMGKIGEAIFCGLPGNPVSSMVTFYKLVLPLLRKLQGHKAATPLKIKAVLTSAIRKKPGRVEYQRGILNHNIDGTLQVSTTGSQDSSQLSSMHLANCFIVLEQQQGNTAAGELVTVEPFNSVLC
ncbi:molybdopterin molybdotransferase MoeA [Shewanella sp. 4t3-1-2LB]|uniref:molybdopterin molybdotransferase MoeA n=1 Tax=Shewanella sp. 4t3-1-2LB TaxID=2817682 RepID=UPI001A992C5A|nr:molybdopterin molybdotransferase MoeA [Shewanella sp. 4t3-1-2LB]MBO1272710.1 molybdopterin molybdotransferase MoeA [Shewanella sp. 4t3-1-2LB]